ncbi:hypothetical protein A2U01_0103699, partial [Trifolium medium]|nr:hypothetical protein [Trifolium medium]
MDALASLAALSLFLKVLLVLDQMLHTLHLNPTCTKENTFSSTALRIF